MRFILWLTIWLRRIVVLGLVLGVIFGGPILYIETACQAEGAQSDYTPLLPPQARQDEYRTYQAHMHRHIAEVHADYARVVADGDPHEFNYIGAATGFWTTLCPLASQAMVHGGFAGEEKQQIYALGSGLTADLLFKAIYEETLGRVAALIRGDERAPLDALSAAQAAEFAAFQTDRPWHEWGFGTDAAALLEANTGTFRDWERAIALNVEYRVEGLVAKVVDRIAVTRSEAPRIRSIVRDIGEEDLAAIAGVTVIGPRGEGVEIETPRHEALTAVLLAVAAAGGDIVEIAGNDDILFSLITPQASAPGALASTPMQGSDMHRHLIETKIPGLAGRLRQYPDQGYQVDYVYDY